MDPAFEEPQAQRRRMDDAPPPWAAPLLSLAATGPQLSEEVRRLKEQFAALSLSSSQPAPPTYPSAVTAEALSNLAGTRGHHRWLPPF